MKFFFIKKEKNKKAYNPTANSAPVGRAPIPSLPTPASPCTSWIYWSRRLSLALPQFPSLSAPRVTLRTSTMIYAVPGTVPGTSVGTYRRRRTYSEALRALGGTSENNGAGKRRFSLTELKTPTPSFSPLQLACSR